jgi:hypothetical protein
MTANSVVRSLIRPAAQTRPSHDKGCKVPRYTMSIRRHARPPLIFSEHTKDQELAVDAARLTARHGSLSCAACRGCMEKTVCAIGERNHNGNEVDAAPTLGGEP